MLNVAFILRIFIILKSLQTNCFWQIFCSIYYSATDILVMYLEREYVVSEWWCNIYSITKLREIILYVLVSIMT